MIQLFELLVCSLALLRFSLTDASPQSNNQAQWRPHHVIHQFTAGTWIENLAVRCNGAILGADYIYRIDLRNYSSKDPSSAEVSRIATVSHAGALYGLVYITDSGLLLVSDFLQGVVWSVDISTGVVAVAINNTDTQASGFAVNGLKMLGRKLYFTNTEKELFASFQINSTGQAVGDAEILAQGGGFLPDDFALDLWGNAYITTFANGTNGVLYVPADTTGPVQIANITGPTAAAFGRTMEDCHILYVSTTGGDYDRASDGAFIGHGAIVGIDLGEKARQDCRRFLRVVES